VADPQYSDDQQHPHLVGHSMGGFVAVELARHGLAATVCALSPGGFIIVLWSTYVVAAIILTLYWIYSV
jgi:pimeloyl-ACP methyl ester carboxylesterase